MPNLPRILSILLSSVTCLLSSLSHAQDFTTGLVQHYSFTNGSADDSRRSPNAVVNAANFTRDQHGYAEGSATLIGNTHFIEFADSVNLGVPGWTYSVWFKLHAMPGEIYDADAFLLTYKTVMTGDDVHLYVDDEDNGLKIFFNNGSFKVSSGITVQRNRWYHAVLRYTASTTDLFVDGNFTLSTAGRFRPRGSYSPLLISSLISTSPNKGRVFGNIDDIRMYKRNLTNADISALYQHERNLAAPPPAKDTVTIRDTVRTVVRDTIKTVVRDTVLVRDTTYLLDTIILGGNCLIYPNPATVNSRIYIEAAERPALVMLYNALGQLVRREELLSQNYILTNGLSAGTYYLKVKTATSECGKKMLIVN